MSRFLFGPVNSRRLGRSLGVDLLPFKTCSLDCIYCECGWTTDKTLRRGELVPTDQVLAELDDLLSATPELDYVTFSGAGEPTLHTGIGTLIGHLKRHYPRYKIAVLTNGSLLDDPVVRSQLADADLVAPSLDAATETAFQAICRPASGLTAQSVIDGIAAFRRDFTGLLLLEIFLVPGQNDSPRELAALKKAATRIAPDAIQLNSLDRPAPYPGVVPPSDDQLQRVRDFFYPLQVQAVRRRGPGEPAPWDNPQIVEEILNVLDKGATSLTQLEVATGIRAGDLAKTLALMARQALVQCEDSGKVRLTSANESGGADGATGR
jgi:wyosine [tRNA(Phe)-imidazoG37] synthetase (radical SAM superfamily)